MENALELVKRARQMGAEFKIDDKGQIWVKGLELLPQELRRDLRQRKEDIFICLAGGVIWETGNLSQIRSLLMIREAELVVANKQLTGNSHFDWHTNNRITNLELQIADLRRWLAQAMEKE
jgi:hypothetical protein